VTAVGTSSVTIKTSSATTTYQVDANSDIDKNGEATLKDLVVGDAVRFSVDSSNKTTIDKLHAGTESLDRPKGAPAGAPGGQAPGAAPAGHAPGAAPASA
jgi:putative ribosome biogenesis GTPase RsgA